MQNNYATIANYFENRLTNASEESFNAKVKAFRNQFRGVSDIPFSYTDLKQFSLNFFNTPLEFYSEPVFSDQSEKAVGI